MPPRLCRCLQPRHQSRRENHDRKRGAFDACLADKSHVVRLVLEHDDCKEIASTDNGLELYSDDYGLAFRCSLPRTRFGDEAHALTADRTYTAMSAAFRFEPNNVKVILDEDVTFVDDAIISECSILGSGAIKQSYCILVDGRDRQSLREEALLLRSDGAFVGVMRAMENVKKALARHE